MSLMLVWIFVFIALRLDADRLTAGGDKIPRKGGPGISQSDLLVINKVHSLYSLHFA